MEHDKPSEFQYYDENDQERFIKYKEIDEESNNVLEKILSENSVQDKEFQLAIYVLNVRQQESNRRIANRMFWVSLIALITSVFALGASIIYSVITLIFR